MYSCTLLSWNFWRTEPMVEPVALGACVARLRRTIFARTFFASFWTAIGAVALLTCGGAVAQSIEERFASLPQIDATRPSSLYAAYQLYALPARVGLLTGNGAARRLLLDRMAGVVDQAKTLEELRRLDQPRNLVPSARLLNPRRSGPPTRRILPTQVPWHPERKPESVPILDEPGIAAFQFMHLLST